MSMIQRFPTLDQMAAHLALDRNAIEVVKQPLYDYNVYPTAGIANLAFFLTAQGAGLSASPGNAGAVKALSDTNMTLGGQLAAPQAFWCQGLEIVVDPGSSAAANNFSLQIPSAFAAAAAAAVQAGTHDVNAILSSGALQLTISQKPYYQEGPLYRFPPTSAMRLDVAMTSTSATVGESVKEKLHVVGEPKILDPGVGIMTSQNFQVNLLWPVIVATPSGFNARIGIVMNGWTFRAVQ